MWISRPSDAIALAVRAHVSILVDESVMQDAGITPETDVEAARAQRRQKTQSPARPAPPVGEVNTERLSVFEDFLGKLDLDKLDDKNKPDSEDDDQATSPVRKADKPSPISLKSPRRNDRFLTS